MLTNKQHVQQITGKTVTTDLLHQAQAIIETFVGRTEARITDPDDLALMANAVAYQAAYMVDNGDTVFEQISFIQLSTGDSSMTFDDDSPFIAPLAKMAARQLTWKRSRSVSVGPVFNRNLDSEWERY